MRVYSGEDYKRIRLNAGLSIASMADLLGINQKSIYNWENDISSPPNLTHNIYKNLEEKIKELKKQEKDPQINKQLKDLLIMGGITAFLVWLFKDK